MHARILAAALILLPFGALAQPAPRIDEQKLTNLYQAYLANPGSEYLSAVIQEERARVRAAVDEELRALVELPDDGDLDPAQDATEALERQQRIVQSLEQRLRERKADLDLLHAEEKRFYDVGSPAGIPAEEFRLTRSHPELLAKKAILEERIAATEAFLPTQRDRLRTFEEQQRYQQFALIIKIVTFIAVIIAVIILERLLRALLFGRIRQQNKRYTANKLFSAAVYVALIVWIVSVLLAEQPGLLAGVAIVGAGVAVALQDALKDFVGWIVIHQNALFGKGDRIAVAGKTGEVMDIGVMRTSLLEVGTAQQPGDYGVLGRTGKVLFIPNGLFLNNAVLNYNTTSDFTKSEMNLEITFESDWRKAEEILLQILEEETGEFARSHQFQHRGRTRFFYIPYEPTDATVFMDIAASGIRFTLKFSIPVDERRRIITNIARKILARFREAGDIDLAYHTVRSFSTQLDPVRNDDGNDAGAFAETKR